MFMDEILYLAETCLRSSEDVAKRVKKVLGKQARINRRFATFIFAALVYTLMTRFRDQELNRKIENLSNDIEELKRMKGE